MGVSFKSCLICLLLQMFFKNVHLQDPCINPQTLGNLPQRVIGYNLSSEENPLSDYRLTPKWYSLPEGFTIATKPDKCGTYFNWWVQDTLPKNGEKILTICQNDGINDCVTNRRIRVRKCAMGYVYELEPTDADMEAYCIEGKTAGPQADDAPDVSSLKPSVSTGLKKKNLVSTLEFYCDFVLPDKNFEKYLYDIEWSLHSGQSKLSSLLLAELNEYETEQKFRDKTKLTENDLKDSLVSKPGFTIVCSVRARKTRLGPLSDTRDSPPKFCGIEILTPSPIRVQKDEEFEIKFKLTIPFGCINDGCSLELDMFVPELTLTNCMLSNLAQKIPFEGRYCGIKFQKVDDIAVFTVTASFGTNVATPTSRIYELVFTTHPVNHDHPFFQRYTLPPITIELLVNQQILQNKDCYAVSDPHMRTFDRLLYENQAKGTFILYRHTELEAEVQIKTESCYNNNQSPFCNCGAAVRAGRDIFLINHCDGQLQPPRIVYCKDSVLNRQIRRNGETYEVMLPHGTKVTLTLHWGGKINVHIYPSIVDNGKSEGLCGLFDGSTHDDQQKRKGSGGARFTDSWRVQVAEDLFSESNYMKMNPWLEELFFCDCSHRYGFNNDTKCTSQRKCKIGTSSSNNPRQDICDLHTRRKKRDAQGPIFDSYTDPATVFYSKIQRKDVPVGKHRMNKRQTAYNNVTAKAECLHLMNTTTFRMCDKIPNLDIDSMVQNCVSDALMTDSMDWTSSHLEGIKQTCVRHVEVMQPLPPEVRSQLVVLPDNTTNNSNNGTIEYQTLPPPTTPSSGANVITAKLLQDMKAASCTNECSGHGLCVNGTCVCSEPYTSFDCSIDKTKPPVMIGIPDKGECDLQKRRCLETSVFGNNFAETNSLTCRIKHFNIDINNIIEYGESVDVAGQFESMYEVYCSLPKSRGKRAVLNDHVSEKEVSYGYLTSVSNDGKTYSEGDTIVIYDSQCVNCTKTAEKIICTKKSGFCVHNGRCHSPGENSGCYVCVDKGRNHAEWSAGPDCKPTEKQETMKVWLIGVIAGSVAIAIVIIVAVLCYIGKRKNNSAGKVDASMTSLPRK